MRIFVVLLVVVMLGWLFLSQQQPEHPKTVAAPNIPTHTASPRPVNEHNWAKHALDKTKKVTREVAEQRKTDETR